VYWLAQRRSASRYLYVKDLLRPGYAKPAQWGALRADLTVRKPVVMIYLKAAIDSLPSSGQPSAGALTLGLAEQAVRGRPPSAREALLKEAAALAGWLDRHYQPMEGTSNWLAFRLRPI